MPSSVQPDRAPLPRLGSGRICRPQVQRCGKRPGNKASCSGLRSKFLAPVLPKRVTGTRFLPNPDWKSPARTSSLITVVYNETKLSVEEAIRHGGQAQLCLDSWDDHQHHSKLGFTILTEREMGRSWSTCPESSSGRPVKLWPRR